MRRRWIEKGETRDRRDRRKGVAREKETGDKEVETVGRE